MKKTPRKKGEFRWQNVVISKFLRISSPVAEKGKQMRRIALRTRTRAKEIPRKVGK